jgi:DMSO reductase anchor subunit
MINSHAHYTALLFFLRDLCALCGSLFSFSLSSHPPPFIFYPVTFISFSLLTPIPIRVIVSLVANGDTFMKWRRIMVYQKMSGIPYAACPGRSAPIDR